MNALRRPTRALILAITLLTGMLLLPASAAAATADALISEPAPAAPLDADGRNGSIYINVTGQGTNITRIYTKTDPQSVGLCTRGYVWVDNDVLAVTNWQCSDMGVATYFDFTVDNFETTFYSGQQICATWDNFVGRPCITVDG